MKRKNSSKKISRKNSKKSDNKPTKKKESSEMICGIGSTYDLVRKSNIKKKIKLPEIKKIKKIGTFEVKGKVAIGDTDITILDNMSNGNYDAYKIDDNLMIIKNSNEKINKNDIKNWVWTYSGKGVGVDSGMFGFFDLEILNLINDLIAKKDMKRLESIKNVDSLRYKINLNSIKRQKERIPYMKYPDLYNGFMANTKLIKEDINIPSNIKNTLFGVIAPTETGDGGFECYIIEDNKALLIGGITQNKI